MQEFLTTFVLQPFLNVLLLLYGFLGDNFGLAIIAFTLIVRVIILPLTMSQLRQSKKMSALAPEMNKLREKYKNDQQKLSSETMALYRQNGINPVGCLGPFVIQFPIWIGLYSAIYAVMPANQGRLVPEGLAHLSQLLYPFLPSVFPLAPLNRDFLWLDLSQPDPVFILAILVGGSLWVQQKMAINPDLPQDAQQASMSRMMLTIMPLMFGFFTITVASGLGVYWLVSNLFSIVLQYFVTGWGSLRGFNPATELARTFGFGPKPQPAPKKGKSGAKPAAKAPASGSKAATNGALAAADGDGDGDEGSDGDGASEDTNGAPARSARSRRRAHARSRGKRSDG